jgi:hypothetical protein
MLVCIRRCCYISRLVVLVEGVSDYVACSEGYYGVSVFEYFGSLYFVSKICACNLFILLVDIFFSAILAGYSAVFLISLL